MNENKQSIVETEANPDLTKTGITITDQEIITKEETATADSVNENMNVATADSVNENMNVATAETGKQTIKN